MTNTVFESRKIKRYGWKPDMPDHRDHPFTAVGSPSDVPPSFDLWPSMPGIYDQLPLGACTGNGWARVVQKILMEEGKDFGVPSRLFIYYYERVIEGTPNEDSGAEIRDGAKVVATQGVPPETDWPYDIARFAEQPPATAVSDAAQHLAVEYKRITVGGPGAPMRSAIYQGFPVVFGFPVPDYFEGNWDPAVQALPIPGNNVRWIGGHCVVATGYDFTRRKYPVPVFLCDNSWGQNWGFGGRFAMDYRWFTPTLGLASDLWIAEKIS